MMARVRLGVITLALLGACGGKSTVSGGNTGGLTVSIVEPNRTASILGSTAITLRAQFYEGQKQVTPDTVTWTSSGGEALPQTNPAENVVLGPGARTITVIATHAGKSGADSITLTVGDIGVEITRPRDSVHAQVAPGDSINLRGTGYVRVGATQYTLVPATPAPGELQATFAWRSEVGAFGGNQDTVASPTTLAAGPHTITLTITYTDPATGVTSTGSASIVLTVNTPPDVAISAPTCPLALAAGTPQTFAGVAADAEDGPLVGAWVDYLTGDTAAGNSWAFQSTVLGKHTLVFSATDSLGSAASDRCTVTVYPAGATADALFPSTSALNTALTNTTIELVAGDGAGNLLVGTQGELASCDTTPALLGDWNTAGLGLAGGGVGTAIVRGVGVSSGKMLVGTSVGLAACTYAAGTVSACTNAEPGIRGFSGIAIAGDLAGSALVAAASSNGLYLASYASGTPTSHFYSRDVLTTRDRVNDVHFDGNTLYVATDSGLCVIRAPAAAVTTVATTLCDDVVNVGGAATSLAQSGGTLWVGTDSGLVGYDLATGIATTDGLPGGRVNDVAVEASGVVWLGTDNGAVRFDPGTGWTTTLRPPDWSGSSTVNSVFIGADGSKWLGTNQGLVHYVGA